MISRSPLHETPEWQRGNSAERQVADILRRQGWFVVPTYAYTTAMQQAPIIANNDESYVLPDLNAYKPGLRRWVEVKAKGEPTYWALDGGNDRNAHGINQRHYRDYLAIEEITDAAVWLVIFEESTMAYLSARLRDLPTRFGNGKDGAMVYFPRWCFFEGIELIP